MDKKVTLDLRRKQWYLASNVGQFGQAFKKTVNVSIMNGKQNPSNLYLNVFHPLCSSHFTKLLITQTLHFFSKGFHYNVSGNLFQLAIWQSLFFGNMAIFFRHMKYISR